MTQGHDQDSSDIGNPNSDVFSNENQFLGADQSGEAAMGMMPSLGVDD